MPLIGTKETFSAIVDGRVALTRCSQCKEDIVSVDTADQVVCGDCLTIMKVEHVASQELRPPSNTIGIGVKPKALQPRVPTSN